MPTPVNRQSLTKTLEDRYATQRAGGTFDVKQTLGGVGQTPVAGTTIDATSMQGTEFQSPNGFVVKVTHGNTQMKDAQGTNSKELSMHLRGFSNVRYKP